MDSKTYYEQHKDTWKTVYYQRSRAKILSSPERMATKRESNKLHMRRKKATRTERYLDNKFMFMRQLGGRCEICDEADYRVLQFDHVVPEKKTGNLSAYFHRKDQTKAFNELHFCRLLCANCHARETYKSGRLRLGRKMLPADGV